LDISFITPNPILLDEKYCAEFQWRYLFEDTKQLLSPFLFRVFELMMVTLCVVELPSIIL